MYDKWIYMTIIITNITIFMKDINFVRNNNIKCQISNIFDSE